MASQADLVAAVVASRAGVDSHSTELSQCSVKSPTLESGVVFVNDPSAEQLFTGADEWNKAQNVVTAMTSVPGAGNTWSRLLVEKGLGLRTGSVFGDGGIKRMGMIGEGIHDSSVIMVKTHYPILGPDLDHAKRIVWLVRHPLTNIVAQAKWHM